MMYFAPFGNLEYSIGWRKNITVAFFGCEYSVVLKLHSYREEDPITEKQIEAYEWYLSNGVKAIETAQIALSEGFDNADTRFAPSMLLISRKGEIALLCDDAELPDEGIAIVLDESIQIISQDDYL